MIRPHVTNFQGQVEHYRLRERIAHAAAPGCGYAPVFSTHRSEARTTTERERPLRYVLHSFNSPRIGVARALLALLVLPACFGGCIWAHERKEKLPLGVDPVASPFADSAAYKDTIGAYTSYEGLRGMRVRGYGLVVGLGNNGSRDCPHGVYDRLVQELYKRHRFVHREVGVESVSPEDLIRDIATSVVVVEGQIPPAALAGDRFDVAVAAVAGTQTKSLWGGRLFTTDLRIYRPVTPEASLTGRVLARADGPVFLNPFAGEHAATSTNPREGVVLGGGVAVADRRLRLVLAEPSYQRVRQIEARINSRFSGAVPVASANSPSFIQLHVPEEFRNDAAHFLALVRALYLSADPQFEAARARMLEAEIVRPTAPHAQIALALEGLGRAAQPVLDRLYDHAQSFVSFHAAAAGLRLGDHVAGDAMARHAEDSNSDFRFQAIRALGKARDIGSTAIALRRLLNDDDPRVQIAAYEELAARDDPTIRTTRLGGDNFVLDVIPTAGKRFIYAKRSGARRIALFGRDLHCSAPVLYRAPDGSVTIHAEEHDERLTVLRTVAATGATSPPLSVSMELPELIRFLGAEPEVDYEGHVSGVGLDYAAVVRALYQLTQDLTIDAEFILEQPNAAELFGPRRPESRPESEL